MTVEDKSLAVLAWVVGLAHHWQMARAQPDLFGPETQPDIFGESETPNYRPDPDKVRARLNKILTEVRAAQELPWGRASLYRTIFPQMTLWLPDEEAAQLRFEFETEMERLKAA
jgi:hypothetical protein